MTSAESDNPYATLDVPRTADARAIKRAYTALIRKFSPESHPEEFKRVRAAYELLSDDEARARYDAADKGFSEYGEGVAERLASVDEALRDGKVDLAESALAALIADRPELDVARERLGQLYLRTDRPGLAAEQFRRLLELSPNNARHLFHLGVAALGAGQPEQGRSYLEQALALAPKDLDTRLVLAAQLRERGKHDEAGILLDEGIALAEPRSADAFLLTVRRAEVTHDPAQFAARLATLEREVRDTRDDELARFVASLLGGVAARAYATDRNAVANQVLACSEALRPDTLLERPLPSAMRVPFAELPEAGRAWLDAEAAQHSPLTLRDRRWSVPLLGVVGSFTLLMLCWYWATLADPPAGAVHMLLLGLGACAMAGVVLFAREAVEELSAPARRLTTIHSVFLVRVRRDMAELYPLTQLNHVSGSHHHMNGVYTQSTLDLRFGKQKTSVLIRGRDQADHFMQAIQHQRQRCLELLSEGCLDAIEGGELFPARALLDASSEQKAAPLKASARRSRLQWLGGGALAFALFVAYVGHGVAEASARQAFRAATQGQGAAGYQRYLLRHPDGAYAAVAREELSRRYERAAQALADRGVSRAGPGAHLFALLAAAQRQGTSQVVLDRPDPTLVAALRSVFIGLGIEDALWPVEAVASGDPALRAQFAVDAQGAYTFAAAGGPPPVRFASRPVTDVLARDLYAALGARFTPEGGKAP